MSEPSKVSRLEIPLRDLIKRNTAVARVEPVEVPEWDCTVYVRGLTGEEFYQIVDAPDDETERLWDTVAKYCVDEHGARVFADDDLEWLKTQSATALQRIVSKARELNSISQDSIEAAEKN